jgi:competence protein ComEA
MSRSDRIMLAAGGAALVLVAAAAWMILSPTVTAVPAAAAGAPFVQASGVPSALPASHATGSATIVVDVQGAVAEPGVRELPAGSRIADAIDAAGGYAVDADLVAAASAINLAEPLVDGGQVRVPRIGENVAAAPGPSGAPAGDGGGGSATGGGLVNLNTATPEELEALPGIGPVTVQKIVAARQERPFASLDDAVQRGVINRGQLEDIQGIATAG